jgi:hypothetical protein
MSITKIIFDKDNTVVVFGKNANPLNIPTGIFMRALKMYVHVQESMRALVSTDDTISFGFKESGWDISIDRKMVRISHDECEGVQLDRTNPTDIKQLDDLTEILSAPLLINASFSSKSSESPMEIQMKL